VFRNSFAGKDVEDLSVLYDFGEYLGGILAKMARVALGISGDEVESYGKAVIVGEQGELEHGHALLHPKLGKSLREECGGVNICTAIIPSSGKIGRLGTSIDVPVHYKRAAFVRSHYDSIELRVPDAPLPGDFVLSFAVTNSGGAPAKNWLLQQEEAKGTDGLR